MRAAVLRELNRPLRVETVPDPVTGTGEVLVEVVAAPVLSYANEVFSGERRYPIVLPMIPGCGAVGRVREVGPDATRLRPGDWVFCDPTVRSRDDALTPDITLQGWSARGEGGIHLQRYFHDGPFAELIRIPTENAVPLGDVQAEAAGRWCALTTGLVPYGGLLAARFQPGETLLVSGATGHFGSAGVAVALAMGAGLVVAAGRNTAVLADLRRRFGERVRSAQLQGDDEDTARMNQAAEDGGAGGIDCVLDLLPPSVGASVARRAILAVRQGGRAVLMGGVGMLGGEELSLPYPWIMRNNISVIGQWMAPRTAPGQLAALVRAGLLRLEEFEVASFGLEQVNEAVEHASAHVGPFRMTVLNPR